MSDTLTTIYEGTQATSGTSGTGGGGSTGGISQSDADKRYFRQSQAFDELATADIDTALTNLGLKDGSRDLDLNSLDINNNSFVDSSRNVTGGTADFSGSLDANTLRTDTGKFLAPTSYQFRNAGDTGFRDVEMGDLTVDSSAPMIQLGVGSDPDWSIYHDKIGTTNDNHLYFERDGTEKLRIEGDGKVHSQSGAEFNGEVFLNDAQLRIDTPHGISGSSRFMQVYRAGGAKWDINLDGDDIEFEALSAGINALKLYDNSGNVEVGSNLLSKDFNNATWAGDGYRGTNAGDWVVENLRVRNALEVYEFVAKQISSVGGKEILSIANGRIESIDTGANTIDVQDVRGQNATSFKAGDLWIVQVTDINNDLQSGGTGSIVRSVRGSVTSVSGETLTVSVDAGALSDLEENDLIVAYGSSDSDRNAIMYRNVDRSDDNLIMRVQTGVTSFGALTDPDNTRVAFGDLYGSAGTAYADYTEETFGFFAGENAGDKITVDADQGVRFLDGSNNVGAQFNASKLTVGDGFEYDAPSNTLDVAGFTVDALRISNTTANTNMEIGDYSGDNSYGINITDKAGGRGQFVYDGSDLFRLVIDDGTNDNLFFAGESGNYGTTSGVMNVLIRSDGSDVFRAGEINQFAGAFFDSDSMWAGGSATSNPSTKSDSNFWAKFDTGELFYDALVITVWARDTIAGFGAGSTADSLQDDEWTAQRASSTAGDNVIENKIKARYRHRFGINNMLLNYLIRVESSGDGTGTGAVYLRVRNQSGTSVASGNIDVGPTGTTEDTLEVDVSSLNVGQYYTVEVDLEAQVGNVNSGTVTITSHLREDAIIYATT